MSYKNRGMFLENILNETNKFYESKDRAYIYKKPTPIKVLNVSYPMSRGHLIDKAVFETISTLDYNGIYKGKYIEFDAKECKSVTSFPLSNIAKHQLNHIENILNHDGIIFIILFMNNKFYLIKGETLIEFNNNYKRKSMPYNYIIENAFEIKEAYMPRLDYLKIIDEIYIKE